MIKNRVKNRIDKVVLVGILKNKRDLDILLTEKWYRIPVAHAPTRQFDYLAFYQPALFGRQGKCIQYYARILSFQTIKRSDLLPNEFSHPRFRDYYFQFQVGRIKKLTQPIRNIIPRRISFGFTTLSHLLRSKNILQLYKVVPIEQITEDALRRAGIRTTAQYYVSGSKKRYRLDFAVFCKRGSIAIECDNKKSHSNLYQRKKDKIKNIFLKRRGWVVIRLSERDIVFNLKSCVAKVKKAVRKLNLLS